MIDLTSEFGRALQQHLQNQYVIWLTMVDSSFTPQPRPVWFIWQNDSFLIFSQPGARKVAHIAKHPKVALHFNTDDTGDHPVMVFTGEASLVAGHPPAREVPEYLEKYQDGITALNMTPQEFSREYSTAIRIVPTEVRGWE